MSYGVALEEDYVLIRDLPGGSIMKITAALAAGTGIFFFGFHMLAWGAGWPGPFLWFGSESRLSDIVITSLSVPLSIFLTSLFGLAVVKSLAHLDWLNFRVKVR